MEKYFGKIVDIHSEKIFQGYVSVENGIITKIKKEDNNSGQYIMPGLVDSHVHIESSMLIPSEFAKLAIQNGTVAVVSDPHEIANVLGKSGIEFMINNSQKAPLKTFFSIPSCVPATNFETSGAKLDETDIHNLLSKQQIKILGEMMNFPGVINQDEDVISKLSAAKKLNSKIDGHIPGISGPDLNKYIQQGIDTDHECFTIEEAIEKIKMGMKIMIREGSAAKNFDNLFPLIEKFNDMCMLCTDDSHPDDMIKYGHINKIIKKGLKQNLDLFKLLKTATLNPINHYGLPVGLLRKNDPADFIVVEDLNNFKILETVIDGKVVYSHGRLLFKTEKVKSINNFTAKKIAVEDIEVKYQNKRIKIIEVLDKELITKSFISEPLVKDNNIISNIHKDILKVVVVNRYNAKTKPSVGFISGFGLKKGAIASSIAHDSHNIIAVGANDYDLTNSINEIIDNKGGLTFVNNKDFYTIPLEFAGLMTQVGTNEIAKKYELLNGEVNKAGCKLTSPFMTLSFMSLLVIPELKIGDKGLFDSSNFKFTKLHI